MKLSKVLPVLVVVVALSVGVPVPHAVAEPPACNDAVDNDGDGQTDYPEDPGCATTDDADETDPDPLPACSDGVDNDGDGFTDYPADEGCEAASDPDETTGFHADPYCAFNGTNCDGMVIDYRAQRRLLRGAIGDPSDECMSGRPILIKRLRADGSSRIMKLVEANAGGEWQTTVPQWWQGRFFAVAKEWRIYSAEGSDGEPFICRSRRSEKIRI